VSDYPEAQNANVDFETADCEPGWVAVLLTLTLVVHADTEKTAADYAAEPGPMLEAYRHVEVASVSDAAEQLLRWTTGALHVSVHCEVLLDR
jgi:hypothetical protein